MNINHFPLLLIQLQSKKNLNEAKKGDFDMVHKMIIAEFQKAYHPVSLDEFDDILGASPLWTKL